MEECNTETTWLATLPTFTFAQQLRARIPIRVRGRQSEIRYSSRYILSNNQSFAFRAAPLMAECSISRGLPHKFALCFVYKVIERTNRWIRKTQSRSKWNQQLKKGGPWVIPGLSEVIRMIRVFVLNRFQGQLAVKENTTHLVKLVPRLFHIIIFTGTKVKTAIILGHVVSIILDRVQHPLRVTKERLKAV